MLIALPRTPRGTRPSPAAEPRRAARPAAHNPRRLLALALLAGLPMAAQSPGIPGVPLHLQNPARPGSPYDPSDVPDTVMDARRIEILNAMRQKAMASDAEKLLRLAKELNDDANAGGAVLTPAEKVHKAAEIEKLAKNVKDKMIYAIGNGPQITAPSGFWQH